MGEKLPYYMVYPEDFLFDDSRKDWRDYEYLKSLYPDMAKRILPFVEEECDRMEADSSMIYDEYPDKLQLRLMCGRICNRVKEALSGDVEDSGTEEETGAKEEGPRAQAPETDGPCPGDDGASSLSGTSAQKKPQKKRRIWRLLDAGDVLAVEEGRTADEKKYYLYRHACCGKKHRGSRGGKTAGI